MNRGCRIGFVAGGRDDRGCYADLSEHGQKHYSSGLTAILAKEHNRTSLIEALQSRSCYATTGERIILGFHIAEFGMGSEIDTKLRPGLQFNRHITGYCVGTQPLSELALIRNGKVFHRFPVDGDKIEFEFDDSQLLSEIAIHLGEEKNPFVYYYLRAIQKDGHIAWSSPIWIDSVAKSAPVLSSVKKKKKMSGQGNPLKNEGKSGMK